jgi:hypothetical protein
MQNGQSVVAGVYFGASIDYDVTVLSPTSLTVVSPALESDTSTMGLLHATSNTGTEPITVVTTGGAYSTPPPSGLVTVHVDTGTGQPVVVQVGPTGGPMAGGASVRITGTGFSGATGVDFGGVSATFTVISDNIIEAVTPPARRVHCLIESMPGLGLCQVQVVVTGANGATSAVAPIAPPLTGQLPLNAQGNIQVPANCECEAFPSLTEYDYNSTTITGVTNVASGTATGSPLGGDTVAITGAGINVLTMNYVDWGPASAQSSLDTSSYYWSPDGHELLVTSLVNPTPSSQPVTIPVSINSVGGETTTLSWTYRPIPIVAAVSTSVLPSSGGTTVSLYGAGFTSAQGIGMMSVGGGGNPSITIYPSNFTVVSNNIITFTSPSAVPGDYTFMVCSPDHACAGSVSPTSNPGADNVMVVYPNQPALTSVSDAAQPGQLALVGPPFAGDQLLIQGVNLDPSHDTVSLVTKTGDVVGSASIVATGVTPSDSGATSAFMVAAPLLASGLKAQTLYFEVTNSLTGQSTLINIAAAVTVG